MDIERVYLERGPVPDDNVSVSKYFDKYTGQLIRPDGSYYKRTDRTKYYGKLEKKHPAKTPLHVARWAIQEFTRPDDWVLDPTMGVGTTAVEALIQGRNAAGVEIEFIDVVRENVSMNNPLGKKFKIVPGDARDVTKHMEGLTFDLVVNNPPYSGDVREAGLNRKGEDGKWSSPRAEYDSARANLAFLRENREYWEAIESIYRQCADILNPGGRFVVAVKDMSRNKKPFKLHEMLGDVLSKFLQHESTVLLKHCPTTLHLNTYEKRTGVKPPLYQTILVFRKSVG